MFITVYIALIFPLVLFGDRSLIPRHFDITQPNPDAEFPAPDSSSAALARAAAGE